MVITADPATTTSAADLIISYDKAWTDYDSRNNPGGNKVLTEQGTARYDFDFADLELLKLGNNVSIDGFISQPLLEDAVTVTVNENASMVTTNILDAVSTTYTVDSQSAGNFNAVIKNEASHYPVGYSFEQLIWSKTYDIGLDQNEVIVSRSIEDWGAHYQVKITPIDNNGDNLTDNFHVYTLNGEKLDENGNILSYDGSVLTFEDNGRYNGSFESYETVDWNQSSFSWAIDFTGKAAINAIDLFTHFGVNQNGYVDGIGQVNVVITEQDLLLITENTSNTFSAFNTHPDSQSTQLENEENFLQGNAALSLETVLGDYQVNIQLSGEKTALKDGNFALSFAYKLPDDNAQRSFVVESNTQTTNTLTMSNVDDVTLTLTELPENNPNNEVVLGTIMVGKENAAEQAAKIVDRNGLILIVYADGSVESL